MDIPKPPKDTELRNIIDKLAQFVARNGPEFENMTKTKQKNNAKFQFLYGGEYYNYYQYKVTTEQAILKQQNLSNTKCNSQVSNVTTQNVVNTWINGSNPTTTTEIVQQQSALHEQIQQSELNLQAQYAVLMQTQQKQIDDTVRRAEEDALNRLAKDAGVDLDMLDQLLQPIMETCTKDSISTGKGWILQQATNADRCEAVSRHLLKKITHETTTFLQKLHIIYLVNDVLHHCARKSADELKKALESVVVPMFCCAALTNTPEQKAKLDKLLNLWESKANYFERETIESLRNPSESYQAYQASLVTKHSSVVANITQAQKVTIESYQSQHNAFVAHATQQIQALEQQKATALQQQNELINKLNAVVAQFQPPSNFQQQNQQQMIQFQQPTGPVPLMSQKIPKPPGLDVARNYFEDDNDSKESRARTPSPSGDNSQDNYNEPTESNSFDETATIPPLLPPTNAIFTQPPPGFFPPPTVAGPPVFPDFSRPPPGFPVPSNVFQSTPPPPVATLPPPVVDNLKPSMPYYDLPAGLMVPLIDMDDHKYKPIDPEAIRLPPPAPPTERLLNAVDTFYGPPSHDRPRDSDGWEKLGLYEYFKAKNLARKVKEEEIAAGRRKKSRSPSPIVISRKFEKDVLTSRRRYCSKSPSPRVQNYTPKLPERRRPRKPRRRRSRTPTYRRERSISPVKMGLGSSLAVGAKSEEQISESNKGHQMLKKMGWGGTGLGAKGQGIAEPISGGEIRDRNDMYKGVGVNDRNDPFEAFRKNKGASFIARWQARAAERDLTKEGSN